MTWVAYRLIPAVEGHVHNSGNPRVLACHGSKLKMTQHQFLTHPALQITGNLLKKKLRVQEQYIHQLPMDTECVVDGVKVVLLDANQ